MKQMNRLLTVGSFISLTMIYYNLSIPVAMPGLWADDAIYILLAEYLSPLSSALRSNAEHVSQSGSFFPPFYPMLLSIVGTRLENLVPGQLLTTAFYLLSVGVFYFWLKLYVSINTITLVSSVLLALLPYNLILNQAILSEPLYLMLSLTAILLSDPKNNVTSPRYIAILVGLSVVTRSVGITLLIAFWIWIIIDKNRRSFTSLFIATVPFVIWKILAPLIYTTQDYSSKILTAYGNLSFENIAIKLVSQLSVYCEAIQHYLDRGDNAFSVITVTIISLSVIPGYCSRLRSCTLDALYFPVYLCIIIIWPYPSHAERFLFPIIPIALFYALHTIQIASDNNKKWSILFPFYLSLILLTILPSSALILQRGLNVHENIPRDFLHTKVWLGNDIPKNSAATLAVLNSIYAGMKAAGEYIPTGACVYTTHYEAFMLYGRRHSKLLKPKHIKDNKIHEVNNCEYLFVIWANSHRAFEPGYPLSRYPLDKQLIYQKPFTAKNPVPVAELFRITSLESH